METGRDDWESPFGIPLPRGQVFVNTRQTADSKPTTPTISHYRIGKSESEINELIQQGYVPFGNLTIVSPPVGFGSITIYAQPMVKYT